MGLSPSSFAFSLDIRRTPAAASLVWDELPAVTLPVGLEGRPDFGKGLFGRSGRTPSSVSKITSSDLQMAVGELFSGS
jgi:hypothetical protein